MHGSFTRRRMQALVAAGAAATLLIAPAAQATGGGDPAPRHDDQGGHAAQQRNRAKQVTPAEQRALEAHAQRHAADTGNRLGLADGEKLHVKDVVVGADGTRHVRYERTYRGLPVIGGDLVVATTPGGDVRGVRRAHRGSVAVNGVQPSLHKSRAVATADERTDFRTQDTTATLSVFADGAHPRLAWDVVVAGVRDDQTPSREHVVVDAHNGKVLTTWDAVETAQGTGHSIYSGTVTIGTTATGSGYTMKDATRGGNYTIDMFNSESGGSILTDADDEWGNGAQSDRASAGVDAQYGAAMTWDYYQDRHGRNGIFDNGQGVPSRVHYGNGYVNAFWDGQQMTYGDGANNADPLVELDVAGHEMSHGVTEATAGLTYTGDAGGLNEATSDIFGTGVEWFADNADDVPDYLIGEEVDLRGNGTPLRRMDDPSALGSQYPDCWSTSVSGLDPHYASAPANHFYYLASEGSGSKVINGIAYDSPTCDGSTVTGIGHETVENIWYTALSQYMVSTETYPEARDDTVHAAIDLYGADSSQCRGIEAAWNAIDVPAGSSGCAGDGGGSPAPGACPTMALSFTGSLSGAGDYAYEPTGQGFSGYYHSSYSGTHVACLEGPDAADFDLYLQKWNGSSWVTVAQSTSSSSHEEISYQGTPGDYSYVVQSYTGSGSFTLGIDGPN